MMVRAWVVAWLLLLAGLASATETPPSGHAIGSAGFNEMLGKQLGADSLKTEQLPDGSFKLTNTVQTVSAHIHKEGVSFDSIGNSQGKGGFTLQLTQWGREGKLQPVVSSSIYSKDNIVYHTHNNGLAEKFSNSSDGIRQDFIVATKPEGAGSLHVQLKVSDAEVQQKGNGAVIALNSGRRLTYDRLAVTDANGKSIPAQMVVAKNNVINVIVDDASASYPLTIDPTVGDENWVGMGSLPGTNGVVNATLYHNGILYIGGSFTQIGDLVVNNIAQWNGSSWSTLGSGMSHAVYSLAVDSSGNLYAGGIFSTAGEVSAACIAKWDGTAWSAMGSGMNSVVYALVVDGSGQVYAGGNFTVAGGVILGRIAKWNGSSWSAVGGGMNFVVYALLIDGNGQIYAGGNFTRAGGLIINRIAKWDGTAWSAFGSGMDDWVTALAMDGSGNLYAGGYFTTAGGVSASRIAKWDGSGWSALGSGMNSNVNALVVNGNGSLYASGGFTVAGGVSANRIAKWDGSTWSALGSGMNSYVNALAVDSAGNFYAGGNFTMAGGKNSLYLAKWLTSGHVKNNLDADGDSDLLTRSTSTGSWTRHTIQNAAITGSAAMSIPTASDTVYVAQLDANGDGDADILTRNTSTGAWYLHQVQSAAVTSTAPIYLYASLDQQFIGAGDFNGDGTDDVMLRSSSGGYYTVFLLSNYGVNSTVFYNAWTASSSVPQGVGDFDGDGTDDLLVRRTSDNLYFIFKTTNGGVANVTCACNLWANPDWTFQFVGDTNKDGTDDIVIRGTGASADGKWWNFRMNNFTSAETTNLNTFLNKTQVSFAASGDYNADGHTDMLIRVNNGPVYVARIVNGLVSGSTTLLSNLSADQVVLK